MIYIDIHRQSLSKNRANICRFVLSLWGNYRELTVFKFKKHLPRDATPPYCVLI